MDRDFDIEPRPEPLPAPALERPLPADESRQRQAYEFGPYRYVVSQSELAAMAEVGRFRTVAVADLERFQYGSRTGEMRRDLSFLKSQGLLQERKVYGSKNESLEVLVLTKQGKKLVERALRETGQGDRSAETQAFYSGLVKPAEVNHDAAIYRMFQAEKAKMKRSGTRVRRVVLDYELKQKVYRPLAKAKPTLSPEEYMRKQTEVARENGLKVTGGKILLPDLRIEYETATGTRGSVDLEVATHHYRGGALRSKAEAGFTLYAPADSVARLSAYDPEHVAEILSF